MKKIVKITVSAFLLVSLLSCNTVENQTVKNIEKYSETWDEIINAGNLELINNSNFTDSITLITSPENVVGIEAFKDYYSNFITGFSDIEFTIVDIFGQSDKLAKHWHFKGTNTGDFFGMPPTGRAVDIEGVTLADMKDGKIAREQDFMDNMVFMQQLGILSSPKNTGIIENAYKSFEQGDIPSVLSLLDPEVEWKEAESNAYADGNPYIGPDAVLKGVFERIGNDYEYFKLADIHLHDMSNNQVLATLRYQAKLKKNNVVFDAQAAHLWTLKDGKVIAFQQFVDTKKLDDALTK